MSSAGDEELLAAVGGLYARLDPPPDDLAAGVLARLAVADLETEFELLSLVEEADALAGVRSADVAVEPGEATVALEYAGATLRVLLRISTVAGRRRIDGWVVPAVPMTVRIGRPGRAAERNGRTTRADGTGRFEFTAPAGGETRLWLLPDDGAPPFVTPPFTV